MAWGAGRSWGSAGSGSRVGDHRTHGVGCGQVLGRGDLGKVMRAHLARLLPGARVRIHRDRGGYVDGGHRIHVPLQVGGLCKTWGCFSTRDNWAFSNGCMCNVSDTSHNGMVYN